MDRLTKIQSYCEVELMRSQIRISEACQAFDRSHSAYDLALYHEARLAYDIKKQVIDCVLDIIQYCSDQRQIAYYVKFSKILSVFKNLVFTLFSFH